MISFTTISLILLAYMLGSVPSAVWIGKMMYNIDVRDYGSGNAGATNTFRVLGKKAGFPVLFIDIFKGFLAVKLIWLTSKYL
jgi:glycerol-3-phosphate acyltransferase PlsY